ncbi:MAG: hypothetical protein V9G13_08600 [Marmoricola sp.]
MSSQVISAPRSSLNPRQAETVARILEATHELLTKVGPDELTIRMVAGRGRSLGGHGVHLFRQQIPPICRALLAPYPNASDR